MGGQQCGYSLTDEDGEAYPCDDPATGWRWYQNEGDHEDLLEAACDLHSNEGGERIHRAEAEVERLRGEVAKLWDHINLAADEWEALPEDQAETDRRAHLCNLREYVEGEQHARAEVARLRATLGRVRAVVDDPEWQTDGPGTAVLHHRYHHLLLALDMTEPAGCCGQAGR